MPIPDDEFFEYVLQAGKQSVEDGDEYIPTLVVEVPDGVQILVLAGDVHPFERLTAVLPVVIDMKPIKVSFTADSFSIIGEGPEVEHIRAAYDNSLERAWNAGEPSVHEALVISIATADSTDVTILPYVRRDGGSIEWKEPRLEKDGYGGRMVEALRLVFA